MVLFRRHPNAISAWDELLRCLRAWPADKIPANLVYYFAHIPGHTDIFYYGEQITRLTREHVEAQLASLRIEEVVKLLMLIDAEHSISRGSIGQCVEAIISSLPAADPYLREIGRSSELDMFVRECAALILAMNECPDAAAVLQSLADSGSWYAGELLTHLKQYGRINPYI